MRRFAFEGKDDALRTIPLRVRRKLELAAVRLSPDEWRALPWHERLALCSLPADREDDVATFRTVLEGFARRSGFITRAMPPLLAAPWRSQEPPSPLARRAAGLRVPITGPRWRALSDDERYAL